MEPIVVFFAFMGQVKSRARPSDDWEQNFELLQQRAENEEFKQRIKGAAAWIFRALRQPRGLPQPVRAWPMITSPNGPSHEGLWRTSSFPSATRSVAVWP